jgi:steroid Delta-isomerase
MSSSAADRAHLQAPTLHAIEWFETLNEPDVARMGELYSSQTFFKDPFNEVHHLRDVQAIFAHMFKRLHEPRFVVTHAFDHDDGTALAAVLTWEFHFSVRADKTAKPWLIQGATHLRFGPTGLITYHRDYWDAAEELYERIPVLGALMRWLKRQATR